MTSHRIPLALTVIVTVLLAACSEKPAADAAPPRVTDPRNIVVDGMRLTGREYLAKFCTRAPADVNCNLVHRTVAADSASSPTGVVRF